MTGHVANKLYFDYFMTHRFIYCRHSSISLAYIWIVFSSETLSSFEDFFEKNWHGFSLTFSKLKEPNAVQMFCLHAMKVQQLMVPLLQKKYVKVYTQAHIVSN